MNLSLHDVVRVAISWRFMCVRIWLKVPNCTRLRDSTSTSCGVFVEVPAERLRKNGIALCKSVRGKLQLCPCQHSVHFMNLVFAVNRENDWACETRTVDGKQQLAIGQLKHCRTKLTVELQQLGQRSAPIGHVDVGVVKHYHVRDDSRIGRPQLIEQQRSAEQPIHYRDMAAVTALRTFICAQCAADLWADEDDSSSTVLCAHHVPVYGALHSRCTHNVNDCRSPEVADVQFGHRPAHGTGEGR